MAKKLTIEQSAVISAYTGVLCGPFGAYHEYVEKVMERPVWTHEMANPDVMAQIREAAKPDFLALCAEQLPSEGVSK
jgi:hypothetical protein